MKPQVTRRNCVQSFFGDFPDCRAAQKPGDAQGQTGKGAE